jgi:hypothetical protein
VLQRYLKSFAAGLKELIGFPKSELLDCLYRLRCGTSPDLLARNTRIIYCANPQIIVHCKEAFDLLNDVNVGTLSLLCSP